MNGSELLSGERQVAETVDGIRADHRARYEWAAERLAGRKVVDAACGVGYGAKILAGAGCRVRAFDRSEESIAFAREHYNHDHRIDYYVGELEHVRFPNQDSYDAVVCFEALEHLEDPGRTLEWFAEMTPELIVSVPNEAVFPNKGYAFHHRHYTAAELEELLNRHGWQVREWHGQRDALSRVEPEVQGRTLIAVCDRAEHPTGGTAASLPEPPKPAPKSVAILGMGASLNTYLRLAAQAGWRGRVVEEVWGINAVAGVLQCDRVFHMDDMRLQERRAEVHPHSNVAGICDWLRSHPGPIYTSTVYPEFPGAVEFPLDKVMTTTGHGYFNSTVAYAVAYAIAIGVKHIHIYGADFSYKNSHKREKGRACVEFWLGIASARGIQLSVAGDSTLLDADVSEDERFYGYDAARLTVELDESGFHVTREPKELPTVEEIERRYAHDPAIDEEKTA